MNNRQIGITLYTCFILISFTPLAVQASADKGTLFITDIDMDGTSTPSSSDWTGTMMSVGDTNANTLNKAYIKFNITNRSTEFNSIRANITSATVWLYYISKSGNPRFIIQSNYSQNDTWGNGTFAGLVGEYNLTDYILSQSMVAKRYYFFDVTSQIKNETNNIVSIVLEIPRTNNDNIPDLYLFNTSESSENRPYMEIQWDNNAYIDGEYKTHYPNLSNDFIQADNEDVFEYMIYIFETTTNDIFLFIEQTTMISKPVAKVAKFSLNPAENGVDHTNMSISNYISRPEDTFARAIYNNYTYTDIISEISAPSLYHNIYRQSKKYYRTSPNATLNFLGNRSLPPLYYMNGSRFKLGGGKYFKGAENFFDYISGDIKYNNTLYTINKTYLADWEHAYVDSDFSTRPREIWVSWDTPEAYGMLWYWQVNETELSTGSMIIKSTGDYISFDNQDIGEYYTRLNRTVFKSNPKNKLQMFNATIYANSSKGYLILNESLLAQFDSFHTAVTTEGFFKYNNGSVINISKTLSYYEDLIYRDWDYVDWVNNGYLTNDKLDVNANETWTNYKMHNFSIRGNNDENIEVGIYNSRKLYNSSSVLLINTMDGVYNNLTILGNGSYNVKSLNISLNSSSTINITVNKYNFIALNFSTTNTTTNQLMNITIYNDTFSINEGVNYHIKKDGKAIQTVIALKDSITFIDIPVDSNSNYEIMAEQTPWYMPPAPVNLTSTQGNFWINYTWEAGTGNVTDGYIVNVNGTWINGTSLTYNNGTVLPHGWRNITVMAYNNSGYSSPPVSNNTQIANNVPILDPIEDKTVLVGQYLNFTVQASDADSDPLTYGTNATEGILDPIIGEYSWLPGDAGVHVWEFNASDGYGGVDARTVVVTVNNVSLSIISSSPAADPSTILGAAQTYEVTLNRAADITWYIDGVQAQTDIGAMLSSYTNSTAGTGVYNVTAVADNGYDSASKQWNWTVNPQPIYVPGIISWSNSKTNNDSLILAVNTSEPINFNVTANQTITAWNWYLDGANQSNNYDNFTASWDTVGTKTIQVNATNSNGTSNTITWTVTVQAQPEVYVPPPPANMTSTTGNFWVNTIWEPEAGNTTDSYNVSTNGIWTNGTVSTYVNSSLSAHAWQNVTVYAYNASEDGSLSTSPAMKNTQIPDNPPFQSPIGNKSVDEGQWLNFTVNATDIDNDTITYDTNITKGSFNATTGNFSWLTTYSDSGIYTWYFNSSDGYDSVASEIIIVTVNNTPLSVTSFLPPSDPTTTQGTTQTFNITLNRTANVTWYMNGTQVQVDTGATSVSYTNSTAGTGTWNMIASATDGIDTISRTWNWTVNTLPPTNYIPPDPTSLQNTTGSFWVNHTWLPGAGNIIDSYNVSANGTWYNGTINTYYNNTVGPHGWSNISVWAYNSSSTGSLSAGSVSQDLQVPNNPPVQNSIGNKNVIAGDLLTFTVSAMDADNDTITYGTNAIAGTLDSTTGVYSWQTGGSDVGSYVWYFNSSDNYGGITGETIIVTVNSAPLSIISSSPVADPSTIVGAPQTFGITLNRTANVTWCINGSIVQINPNVISANYTNFTAGIGVYNINATASDGVESVSREWTWTVTVTAQDTTPPAIYFTLPTPDNNSIISTNYTQINLSISEQNLDTFRFNWNGINYSFYDPSLVLAFNFNNNSAIGETAVRSVDISRYKNNGTINGAVITAGKFGNALQFDGINDYITIPDSSSLDNALGSENFTLEAWVYPKNWVNYRGIINKRSSYYYNASPGGLFSDANGIRVVIGTGNSSQTFNSVSYKPSLNKWHHIVGTADGSTLRLYVDGVLRRSTAITVNPPPNSDPLTIGSLFGSTRSFNGSIDGVRIYNRSLSADEIRMHYQSEFQKYSSAEWRFYNNITNLADGDYSYYGWANDITGNSNSSEIRTVTIVSSP